ncbi:MAG: non-heme ferritin [Candidatus Eiseniibacteriota bacterium]|jgi:ferritin
MLSDVLLKKLNDQIALEHDSASLYLQMSAWCLYRGLEGCAHFLRLHSQEEMGHMYKLFDYVNETGALAHAGGDETPPRTFDDIVSLFRQTLDHERLVTARINDLTDTALAEKDFSTFNFLQWYVAEQHEEEALFKSILDKLELVGPEGPGLFMIDREIGSLRTGVTATADRGRGTTPGA